jgi:hypothetical protein
MEGSMHGVGTAEPQGAVPRPVEDEHTASRSGMLISGVEAMPRTAHDALVELLGRLECARPPSAAGHLMSGTAGTFSRQSFYRPDVIHLMQGDGPRPKAAPAGVR